MVNIIFKLIIVFFATWYPYSLVKIETYNKEINKLYKRIDKLEQENKKLKEFMK